MPVFLPPNLATLAKLCDKSAVRFALDGLRATLHEGAYRVDASDGRVLGIAQGDGSPDRPPDYPALADAADGTQLVARADWEAAFKLLSRKGERLGLGLDGDQAVFATRTDRKVCPVMDAKF